MKKEHLYLQSVHLSQYCRSKTSVSQIQPLMGFFIEITSHFSSFVVSSLVSVAMVSVPSSARVLRLADVDAAI